MERLQFSHERIDISFGESSFRGWGGGEVRPLIKVQSVIARMKRIQFCLERIDISYGESFFLNVVLLTFHSAILKNS